MFKILDQSGKKMVKYLDNEIPLSNGVINLQETYSKYTLDVIASIAFGLDSKAFEQRDQSTFEKMAGLLQFKFSGFNMIRLLTILTCPTLADFLGMALLPPEPMDFFSSVIKSAIKFREETKEKRDDFLQLILETRAGQLKSDDVDGSSELTDFEKDAIISPKEISGNKVHFELEDDDIVAQSVLFILGGYDTTQALLLFAAYNLAVNPDIQERVYQEVKKSVEDNNGELTYDSVNSMEYLDMFINGGFEF